MKRLLKIFLVIILILSILLSIGSTVLYIALRPYKSMKIDKSIISSQMHGRVSELYAYDFIDRPSRNGKAYALEDFKIESGERYKYVEFETVPKNLVNAFVSIEDKRFYSHNGVDFLRTAKAGLNFIFKKNSSFGGSSITQQLVKNLTGDNEKSIKRKLREIFCAIDLEINYSKDEIMGMYLNVINLGNRCRGVASAAEFYFSKEIDELSLCECATIAAITNNPTYYDPIRNPQNTLHRRDLILKCMFDNGFISSEEFNIAIDEDISLNLSSLKSGKINSWYTDMVLDDVINDLASKFDINKEAASNIVYNGGLKIYTAMDERVQHVVEEYYRELIQQTEFTKNSGLKSSFILIDIKTGDILGVAGDVGEKQGNRLLNLATDSQRPSGSAIKPLSVYAPAFEKGIIKWSSIYSDSPIRRIGGKEWPSNAGREYLGDVDIEYAVANSLNTVSVRVLNDLGMRESFDFLKYTLHLNTLCLDTDGDVGDMCESSLALGQHKKGVTLRELSGGYTIFADGIYKKPRSYFKVTDAEGNILLENEEIQERAISEQNAFILTKLLCGVVKNGTAKNAIEIKSNVEVAGKTGTTTDMCDRYFVGYTPDIIGGCWMGYEYPKKIESKGNPTLKIWNDILNEIYSLPTNKYTDNTFKTPLGVRELSYDKGSGLLPNIYSSSEDIKYGWFAD